MPLQYNRPGVYLEENLLTGIGDTGTASTVFLFVGAAAKGRSTDPVRIESWTDYVNEFGGFDKVKVASADPEKPPVDRTTYLPYAVYSFYQNGGRVAYVQRAFSPTTGAVAEVPVQVGSGESAETAFTISAKSAGLWGNSISVRTFTQEGSGTTAVFSVQVMQQTGNGVVAVERFSNISYNGEASVSGTKRIDEVINDPVYGSKYIQITNLPESPIAPATSGAGNYANHSVDGTNAATAAFVLIDGEDPVAPTSAQFEEIARDAVEKIDGPVVFNVTGYLNAAGSYVGSNEITTSLFDRGNVVYVDDKADPRDPGTDSSTYAESLTTSTGLGTRYGGTTAASYVAAYAPWLIVPNPGLTGATITVPPAGAVMGVIARTDATRGVFRSPAGVDSVVSNALGVDTKFTDAQLGVLNTKNVNILRPVTGRGICVMGARTRKSYGVDKYLSARRTLIYLREALSDATQFAVFENNDANLWNRLEATAERILRPVWTAGGLAGDSAASAYFIVCNDTINTPATIAAGEVRMDIGVALQYPAEFVIIRLTQFEQGGSNVTIQ